MRDIHATLVSLALALVAAGCTAIGESAPTQRRTALVIGSKPSDLYALIARRIRGCWFDSSDPVLTHHEMRKQMNADSTGIEVAINELGAGKSSPVVYAIAFKPDARGTRINMENLRLPYALGQKLSADIGRWAQGNLNCESFADPGSANDVRGSF